MAEEESMSLEYSPTWIVALVCFIIVFISLFAERLLHSLGKTLKTNQQVALFEAVEKLKEELMLLGFISLLLTVFQTPISRMCIPKHLTLHMLPCKREHVSSHGDEDHNNDVFSPETMRNGRRLLSGGTNSQHCAKMGKAPLLSLEAIHQLHIFIFVLAVVHVAFCATTMILGGAKIREWKHWEHSIRHESSDPGRVAGSVNPAHAHRHLEFFRLHAVGFWRKSVVISWIRSFFKQFYGSVTKSDYIAMRLGFIMTHCRSNPNYNFHKFLLRTIEADFKKVVGISWHLWLFVVFFLLLNIQGWHSYFWLSFLPLILLLLVGTKLVHIITELAEEVAERKPDDPEGMPVRLSDDHFWFGRPYFVLYLIHFILFQNSFEMAFFFWVWCTYGFKSCIMEQLGYIIPRLIIGVLVQVLCSYSTLPLYAIVTQMGSMFKESFFQGKRIKSAIEDWGARSQEKQSGIFSWLKKKKGKKGIGSSQRADYSSRGTEMLRMATEAFGNVQTSEWSPVVLEGITTSITECSDSNQNQTSS